MKQLKPIFNAVLSTSQLLCREWQIYDQLFSKQDNHNFLMQTAKDFFSVVDETIYCIVQLKLCTLSDPAKSTKRNQIYKNISLRGLLAEIKDSAQDYKSIEKLVNKFEVSCKPIRDVRNKLIAHADLDHYYKNPYYVSRKRIRICVKRLENTMNEIARQHNNMRIDNDPLHGDGSHLLEILRKNQC